MVQAGERTGNAPLLPPFFAAATLQVPRGRGPVCAAAPPTNYFVRLRAPAPPGHQCPGYAGNENPAEAGSEVKATPPGAGFTRLFGRSVARALMPGRGRTEQSDEGELLPHRSRRPTPPGGAPAALLSVP